MVMYVSDDGKVRHRIDEFILTQGITRKEFAETIGMNPQNLSLILNGIRGIPKNMIQKILSAYKEIYPDWLRLGIGEMYTKDNVVEDKHNESLRPRLPVNAAAGKLSDYLGGVLAHECEMLPIIRHFPDYDFTMIVKGNSMEPKFEGGDEIACKQVNSVIKWGESYVLATRDGAVLKRLYPHDNGVRCVSYNGEEYPDFVVNADDILAVYKVVGLLRTE